MFTVYTKPDCSFCEQAKNLLKSKGEEYQTIHVDIGQTRIEGERYISRDEFLDLFSVRTLPLIFSDKIKIGGFSELKKFLNESNVAQ